jgi:hypothetical protein
VLELSPQGERLRFQLSDSDDATRDPEPVLPSIESDDVPAYAPFSAKVSEANRNCALNMSRIPRGRALSRNAVETKPEPIALEFQMLLLQPGGSVVLEKRSESVPLRAMPPAKSRERAWRFG